MGTKNVVEPMNAGTVVAIRNSGYHRAKIAEFLGPLGPNAARIQKGMTVEQVEAILGPPRIEGWSGWSLQGPRPIEWETRGLRIGVWLDNDKLVRDVDVHESERPSRMSQWLDWMMTGSYRE